MRERIEAADRDIDIPTAGRTLDVATERIRIDAAREMATAASQRANMPGGGTRGAYRFAIGILSRSALRLAGITQVVDSTARGRGSELLGF